jgi:hypothetical protein
MHITQNLQRFERNDFSQFGEDGVIEKIAADLGIERGTFFEFGIGPPYKSTFEQKGLEGNFVLLRKKGWSGVFLDGNTHPAEADVRREFITALNINYLYRKHGLPGDLDFMSIDVDGQEFWIWMALICRPKVVVIEFNGSIEKDLSITIQFDVNHVWDGTVYHGASLRALEKLGKAKEYTLIWSNGVNAIFVRDDLVSNKSDFTLDAIYKSLPPHHPDLQNRPWVTI